MVQFYKPGQSEGSIFPNTRRQHDRSPDIQGKCLLTIEDCQALLQEAQAEGGATLYINGWNKQGRNGPWMSLSPKAKYRSNNGGQQPQQQPQQQGGMMGGGYNQQPQQQPQGGMPQGGMMGAPSNYQDDRNQNHRDDGPSDGDIRDEIPF